LFGYRGASFCFFLSPLIPSVDVNLQSRVAVYCRRVARPVLLRQTPKPTSPKLGYAANRLNKNRTSAKKSKTSNKIKDRNKLSQRANRGYDVLGVSFFISIPSLPTNHALKPPSRSDKRRKSIVRCPRAGSHPIHPFHSAVLLGIRRFAMLDIAVL